MVSDHCLCFLLTRAGSLSSCLRERASARILRLMTYLIWLGDTFLLELIEQSYLTPLMTSFDSLSSVYRQFCISSQFLENISFKSFRISLLLRRDCKTGRDSSYSVLPRCFRGRKGRSSGSWRGSISIPISISLLRSWLRRDARVWVFWRGRGLTLGGIVNKNIIGKSVLPMNDLQQNLMLGRGRKQGQQMGRRFEDCELKIKTLRNKNNELQKQCDNELEGDIRSAIKSQTSFIEHEIKDMKRSLQALAKDFTDPASKKKIKELCNQASREMERNNRIMGEFVSRASNSGSSYRRESTTNAYRRSKTEFENNLPPAKDNKLRPVYEGNSELVASEDQLSDIRAEQRMMAERNALIKELEEKNCRINEIINQMGGLVGGEQGDMVDQIGHNLQNTNENVANANDDLQEAGIYEKKGRKKCLVIVGIILVLILIAAGVAYFLLAN